MSDEELVRKKLAFIETCLRELRTLARPERIAADVVHQRFVAYTLQIAIQRPKATPGGHAWGTRRRAGSTNGV